MSQPEANVLQVGGDVEEAAEFERLKDSKGELTAAGAVAQSMTAKALIVILNALTGVLSARSLAPAGRGALTALILWPVFLGSSLTLGIPSALTFQMRSRRINRSNLLGCALFIGVVTGFTAALLGAIFLPHWIPQYSPSTIFWARILVLSAPMQSIALLGRSALESDGNFAASNALLLSGPAFTVVGLLALIASGHMTPITAAWVYVLAGVPPLVWMLRYLWRQFRPALSNFKASLRPLLGYGLASYGIDLCGSLALYVDQAMVVRLLAPAAMGTYAVALSVSRMLNLFSASVVMVLFPRSVGLGSLDAARSAGRAARMTTLLTATGGAVLLLFGPQVLTALYSAQFRAAGPVLRILVLEVIVAGAATVLSQAFMALGRPGIVTSLQVAGLALTIPLMLALVPRYGIVGAGVALLCSTIFRLLCVLVCFPLFLRAPIPRLIPTLHDCATVVRFVSRRWRPSRTASS